MHGACHELRTFLLKDQFRFKLYFCIVILISFASCHAVLALELHCCLGHAWISCHQKKKKKTWLCSFYSNDNLEIKCGGIIFQSNLDPQAVEIYRMRPLDVMNSTESPDTWKGSDLFHSKATEPFSWPLFFFLHRGASKELSNLRTHALHAASIADRIGRNVARVTTRCRQCVGVKANLLVFIHTLLKLHPTVTCSYSLARLWWDFGRSCGQNQCFTCLLA